MKHLQHLPISALLIGLGPAPQAFASDDYALTHSTAPYIPLTAATVVVQDALIFSGVYNTIPIGFTFTYWGSTYTTFAFNTHAYCSLGVSGTYGFYPFYTNLKGLGDSQISYVLDVSGGVGHRILKVEWKHVGFAGDATNTDHANFQFWLREGSNAVEIHYGQWNVAPAHFMSVFGSASGPQVDFSDPSGGSFYNLQGDPSAPNSIYHPSTFLFLTGYPANGAVYTFTPAGMAGISDATTANEALILFPQPAVDQLHVALPLGFVPACRYAMMGENGALVLEGSLAHDGIDIASVPDGVYVLRIDDGSRTVVKRFIHTTH